jgi:uncharacterized BrkB/YihY/UPF0761 family membrane protein
LVVSAGYALAAATTTPFTWPADVVTAVPIVVVGVLAVVLWPAHPDRSAALVDNGRPRPRHPYLGWVVLLAVVVGWELLEYLGRGSRSAHPTLSSMSDAFDAHAFGKAVAFLAWLWLGAAIVRAGTPVTARLRTTRTRTGTGTQPA